MGQLNQNNSETQIRQSQYFYFFLAGLLINIICAWFSKGVLQHDEHFQILEFCNYKLGNSEATDLPWEFASQIRAAFLPGVVYFLAKMMHWLNIYNPFILAFILRLSIGIISWFMVCKICLFLLPNFKSAIGKKLFVYACMFLWFVPYISVRFTPENISGILILAGIYLILNQSKKNDSLFSYLISGFAFGLALYLRLQIVGALAGFLLWSIFIHQLRFKKIVVLGLSMSLAIAINIILDRWFYGEWTITVINYFYENIIMHKAAEFGVFPWWYYFYTFSLYALPPISILMLIAFFRGIIEHPKDPWVWTIIPFLLLHCLIGHKELRFLFPVYLIFIYLSLLGLESVLLKYNIGNTIQKYKKTVLVIANLNIVLMLARVIIPQHFYEYDLNYLYKIASRKGTVVFYSNENSSLVMMGLKRNFFMKEGIQYIGIDEPKQVDEFLQQNHPKSAYLLSRNYTQFNEFNLDGYQKRIVYPPISYLVHHAHPNIIWEIY